MRDPDRWTRRFAYFPTKMWCGEWIWWRTYLVRKSRQPVCGGEPIYMRAIIQRMERIPEPRSIPLPKPAKK